MTNDMTDMADQPSVTVIIPFLDVAPFLAAAVESVLGQDYPAWELVLVDDGSTDGSSAIARSYAERYPDRIRHVEHPGHANRGISASRNLGRAHARGSLLASLDGDDVWLPNRLSDQMEILRRHPEAGMIVGASRYWHSWTGREEDAGRDRVVQVGGPQDSLVQPPRLLELLYPLGPGLAPSMNTVLVRADLADRVGGWEESFTASYEDQAFLTKIYLVAPVYIASSCWDLYRQRPGSIMQVELTGAGYDLHRARFLTWLEGYLIAQGKVGTPAWRLLRRARRHYSSPRLSRVERLGRRVLGRLLSGRLTGRRQSGNAR